MNHQTPTITARTMWSLTHKTPTSTTTLTITANGMFKFTHQSPAAFKYTIKKSFKEQFAAYNKMVNYSLGINQ